MEIGSDYKIEKLEKGPLQRFKNQNLLLKKFGEVGLQIYKAITGKRSSKELRKDLDMDDELLTQMLNYMEEAGMINLIPTTSAKEKGESEQNAEENPEEAEQEKEQENPEEEIFPPIESLSSKKKKKGARKIEEEPAPEEDAAPVDEISPELEIKPEFEETPIEEAPKKGKKSKPATEPTEEPTTEQVHVSEEESPFEEEISPEFVEEKSTESEEESKTEEETPEEEPSESEEEIESAKKKKEDEEFAPEEISFGGEETPAEEEEKPVEKTIRDKYGDIGIRVYNLIDGQRTAEEIMNDTGLTEAKLVEILDFLDEQGIIKLEYPRGKAEAKPIEEAPKEMASEEFTPMVEEDEEKGIIKEISPDIIPIRPPLAIVKSVQVRAKVMLRFSDVGDKVLSAVDGKSDLIDLALKLNIPLHKLMEVLNFLRDEGGIILNLIPRTEVRRKYGDDGFNIYKRFGKEGLMLYELIGKEMTIKDMADRITTNRAQVVDMFLFIYEVLGIELPLNRDALMKQLGL